MIDIHPLSSSILCMLLRRLWLARLVARFENDLHRQHQVRRAQTESPKVTREQDVQQAQSGVIRKWNSSSSYDVTILQETRASSVM